MVSWRTTTFLSRCCTCSACGLAAVKNDAMSIHKRPLAKRHLLCTAAPAAQRRRRVYQIEPAADARNARWEPARARRSVRVFRSVSFPSKRNNNNNLRHMPRRRCWRPRARELATTRLGPNELAAKDQHIDLFCDQIRDKEQTHMRARSRVTSRTKELHCTHTHTVH